MSDGIDTADQAGVIFFDRSFDGGPGELVQLSPLVRRMLAGNSGPMTFTGTRTYVVGTSEVAIIDPGPDRPDHVAALLAALRGETITTILVTHTRRERVFLAHFPRQAIGNAVYAANDFDYAPDVILRDGDAIEAKNFSLVCVETPGHAMNHQAFALPQESALFRAIMSWPGRPLSSRPRMARCAITWHRSKNSWLATIKLDGAWRAGQGAATFCPCAPPASPRLRNRDPLPLRGRRLHDRGDRRERLRGPRPGAYQRGRRIGPRSHRGSGGARDGRDRRAVALGALYRPA